MTWQPPNDDEAWREALGAYLDDELPAADRAALEAHLSSDLRRAAELDEMRRLRSALHAWPAPATAPTPEFMAQLAAARRTTDESPATATTPPWNFSIRWIFAWPRWGYALALYALGLLSGAGTMLALKPAAPNGVAARSSTRGAATRLQPTSYQSDSNKVIVSQAPAFTMTSEQAETLLHEVRATALREECLAALRRGDRAAALRLAANLQADYPDTQAMKMLSTDLAHRQSTRLTVYEKGL
jgi:anti-sigma factor RsiW